MVLLRYHDYTIEPIYRAGSKAVRDEIALFWLDTKAIVDVEEAKRRVDEVVCVVRNLDDELVALSTVYVAPYGDAAEPLLHYRMFIRPADRGTGLMKFVTKTTRQFFDEHAALRDGADGMVIVTENPKLMRAGVKQIFEESPWQAAGKDSRGMDVWRYSFARVVDRSATNDDLRQG